MSQLPNHFDPGPFPRTHVQDILDEAQLDAGLRFADIPRLRDQLQEYLRGAIEECNHREVDPMGVLYRAVHTERTILDAYNKHRLGNAITQFNAKVLEPGNAVEYKAAENIPEISAWFPLRAAVSKRGVFIQAPPIYQVEEPAEAYQQYAPRLNAASEAPVRINHTRKKTTNNSAAKAKKTRGSRSPKYNKLRDAPSPRLSFPSGNLTMAEITAFIPQAIKSVDVIDRFLYNGALSATLADMINYYRMMPLGPIENNSIYRMMKTPMDVRAKTERVYQGWTVTKHATIPKPAGFDHTSVSVANFRAPQNYSSREVATAAQQPPPTILFRDMVEGVKTMPSGYDALDLTRCIEYCIENKDQDWYYPQDFARLVSHLGGAADVHHEHQDAAAIARHTSGAKTSHAERISAPQHDNRGRWTQAKESIDSSDDEETGSESDENTSSDDDDDDTIAVCTQGMKRNRTVSFDEPDEDSHSSSRLSKRHKKDAPSRGRKATLPNDISSESDSDVYIGPKNSENARIATRSSSRSCRFSGSYNVDEAFDSEVEDG